MVVPLRQTRGLNQIYLTCDIMVKAQIKFSKIFWIK
jgi:hypothetical protein